MVVIRSCVIRLLSDGDDDNTIDGVVDGIVLEFRLFLIVKCRGKDSPS